MFLDRSQKVAFLGFISGGPSDILSTIFSDSFQTIVSCQNPLWACWKKPCVLHLTLFFLLLVSGYWGRFLFPRKNLLKSLRVGKFKEFHCFPHIILCVRVQRKWGKNEERRKGWMVTFKMSILSSWFLKILRIPKVCTSSEDLNP